MLHALKLSGAMRACAQSEWRRRRLVILCYHGVSIDDEHLWEPALFVSAGWLEGRLRLLRDSGANVLPLGEAVERLAAGELPPQSVAITFDDGLHDFYLNAMPLLRKYGMPATLYLSTWYCRHPRPVFRVFCSYLLWKGAKAFRGGPLLHLSNPDLRSAKGRAEALDGILRHVGEQGLSKTDKDALAERLAGELGLDYAAILHARILQLMTPQEVGEAAGAGIDIELHTHRHRVPNDKHLFVGEIADNSREIEAMTGRRPRHFCYPSGVYESAFLPWLSEQGIVSATTCEAGIASRSSHPLLLPRVIDHCGLSPIEIEGCLSGLSFGLRWQTYVAAD